MTETTTASKTSCTNCSEILTGPFCANCGQSVRDLHRPLQALLAEAGDHVFSLDTRFARTLWPLFRTPGHVTKEYLAGHRVVHVPPLRVYLIAALVFFGLFTVFPTRTPPVYIYTSGSAAAEEIRKNSARGSRVTIELPRTVLISDEKFQEASARALKDPDGFALATYRNIPRAFFLFVPIFALLLKLFYRRQGYYIDHLVFSLYYHAFVFLTFALLFLLGRATWLPGLLAGPLRWVLTLWLIAYLPMALRRVYGGSWPATALKTMGLGLFYLFGFVVIGFPFIILMAMITF